MKETTKEMNIFISNVQDIMNKKLGNYQKMCSRWVLWHLFAVNKATGMGLCIKSLMQYHADDIPFLHCILIGDETWVHHVTPETKKASKSWRHLIPL